jgi:hypothetical protein
LGTPGGGEGGRRLRDFWEGKCTVDVYIHPSPSENIRGSYSILTTFNSPFIFFLIYKIIIIS